MAKTAKTTPAVAAFFLKVGGWAGSSERSGAGFVRCNGTGERIAEAMCVPGVFDAWALVGAGQIGMILEDSSKVHPFIFPKGGMVLTTTDPQLIEQLSGLPEDCCEQKEPHPNALKALGVEIPKPARVYPAPVKPVSSWFKRSSRTRPATGSRGSFSTLESTALDVLKKLRDIGVVALNHIDGQIWKVTGLNIGDCRTVVGFDNERLVITTSHRAAVKVLGGSSEAVKFLTVFGPHTDLFPIVEMTTEEADPDAATRAANLAAYAAQKEAKEAAALADAMSAEVAEASAKPKPARKSRARVTEQATVTA